MGNYDVTISDGKAVLTRKGKTVTAAVPVEPEGTEAVVPETPAEETVEETVEDETPKPGRRNRGENG